MGQYFFNCIDIIQCRLIRVVLRDIFPELIFFNVFLNFFSKSDIRRMTRAVGNNVGMKRVANQGEVSYHVQQFVPGRFIWET